MRALLRMLAACVLLVALPAAPAGALESEQPQRATLEGNESRIAAVEAELVEAEAEVRSSARARVLAEADLRSAVEDVNLAEDRLRAIRRRETLRQLQSADGFPDRSSSGADTRQGTQPNGRPDLQPPSREAQRAEAALRRAAQHQDAAKERVAEAISRQRSGEQEVDRLLQVMGEVLADIAVAPAVDRVPTSSNPWTAGWAGQAGMIWPTDGQATSHFGMRDHPILGTPRQHAGLDIPAPAGQVILAVADGTVTSAAARGGYGLAVHIDHGNGLSTLYGHAGDLLVDAGDDVVQGEPIALVGSTGLSTGPHLHFEVRREGTPLDPMAWFSRSRTD